MRSHFGSFLAVCLALAGCNTPAATDAGGGGGTDGGSDTGSVPTIDSGTDAATTPVVDGGSDTGALVADGGSDGGSDAGCTGVLLTVIDSSSWCDITVNGGAAFGGEMETLCVPAASDVTLVQTAHTGFILGKWFGTSGDTGSGDTGTVAGGMSTVHVTTGAAGTSTCVSTCCPFTSGTGCPATDACP